MSREIQSQVLDGNKIANLLVHLLAHLTLDSCEALGKVYNK